MAGLLEPHGRELVDGDRKPLTCTFTLSEALRATGSSETTNGLKYLWTPTTEFDGSPQV
jgi:hypothetical protein